jgi:hypothetical protein
MAISAFRVSPFVSIFYAVLRPPFFALPRLPGLWGKEVSIFFKKEKELLGSEVGEQN